VNPFSNKNASSLSVYISLGSIANSFLFISLILSQLPAVFKSTAKSFSFDFLAETVAACMSKGGKLLFSSESSAANFLFRRGPYLLKHNNGLQRLIPLQRFA